MVNDLSVEAACLSEIRSAIKKYGEVHFGSTTSTKFLKSIFPNGNTSALKTQLSIILAGERDVPERWIKKIEAMPNQPDFERVLKALNDFNTMRIRTKEIRKSGPLKLRKDELSRNLMLRFDGNIFSYFTAFNDLDMKLPIFMLVASLYLRRESNYLDSECNEILNEYRNEVETHVGGQFHFQSLSESRKNVCRVDKKDVYGVYDSVAKNEVILRVLADYTACLNSWTFVNKIMYFDFLDLEKEFTFC